MPPRKQVKAVRLDDDLMQAMHRLYERDGVPQSEQIRRALRPWLEARGVLEPKPAPKKKGR